MVPQLPEPRRSKLGHPPHPRGEFHHPPGSGSTTGFIEAEGGGDVGLARKAAGEIESILQSHSPTLSKVRGRGVGGIAQQRAGTAPPTPEDRTVPDVMQEDAVFRRGFDGGGNPGLPIREGLQQRRSMPIRTMACGCIECGIPVHHAVSTGSEPEAPSLAPGFEENPLLHRHPRQASPADIARVTGRTLTVEPSAHPGMNPIRSHHRGMPCVLSILKREPIATTLLLNPGESMIGFQTLRLDGRRQTPDQVPTRHAQGTPPEIRQIGPAQHLTLRIPELEFRQPRTTAQHLGQDPESLQNPTRIRPQRDARPGISQARSGLVNHARNPRLHQGNRGGQATNSAANNRHSRLPPWIHRHHCARPYFHRQAAPADG